MRCLCSDEYCVMRLSGSPKTSFRNCSKSCGIPAGRAIEVPRGSMGQSAAGSMEIRSFSDFWPYYVRAHSRGRTRLLHAIGSVLAAVIHRSHLVEGNGHPAKGTPQGRRRRSSWVLLAIIREDVEADADALVADVDLRPGDEFLDVVLRFVAERAVK